MVKISFKISFKKLCKSLKKGVCIIEVCTIFMTYTVLVLLSIMLLDII